MKKVISLLLIFMISLSLYGYSSKVSTNSSSDSNVKVNDNKKEETKKVTNTKGIDVSLGQNIDYPDHYNISFEETLFSRKVEPTNPTSYYHYYEPKDSDNNTYLVLKTTIKNLGSEALDGDKLPNAKLIFDGKYNYDASLVTEYDDGSDLQAYSWYMDIDPLKTKKIWYLVEVPNEVETNTNATLIMQYKIDNKNYNVKIR